MGVTLFEAQLIRAYLLSNDGNFFKKLAKSGNLVIFTTAEFVTLINNLLGTDDNYKIKVIAFSSKVESFSFKLFSSLLRWSLRSSTIFLKMKRSGKLGFAYRFFCYAILSRSKLVINILRRFLYSSLKKKSLVQKFSEKPPKLDILFVTSLTNTINDCIVAHHYKKQKSKIFGTVRSWDNLTSHGNFHIVPDYFFSHSDWTTYAAKKFQKISMNRLIEWGNPAYFNLPTIKKKFEASTNNNIVQITYASMAGTNKDDSNFINWLSEEFYKLPNNFQLTILEHPKFKIDLSTIKSKINLVTFEFASSKLEDYYDFLSKQDLVICGGTSVVLDCAKTDTPIVLISFEIAKQEYWFSALRYFDNIEHSCALFSKFDYPVANSGKDLIEIIKKREFHNGVNVHSKFFIGNDTKSLDEKIKLILATV